MTTRVWHMATKQERADTQVRPYGIQINIPKIHAPPCAIVSLKISHPIRESAAYLFFGGGAGGGGGLTAGPFPDLLGGGFCSLTMSRSLGQAASQ